MGQSITIKPVSNWATAAENAIAEGVVTAGFFILGMALCGIAIPPEGMREVMRVYSAYRRAREPIMLSRGMN